MLRSNDFIKMLGLFVILYALGCKSTVKEAAANLNRDTVIAQPVFKSKDIILPKAKIDRAKYHTTKDTILIYAVNQDTLKFSKNDFNDIIDNFPDLYDETIESPDTTYLKSVIWVDLEDSLGNKRRVSFSSEVGQDEYYILYAYFLKLKNGIAKYSVRRKNLIEIYHTLNDLFGQINYGGTYFGHQYSRTEGYAEFSVYWFKHYGNFFDRPYDISKQKAIYLAGLKQMIFDEVEIDGNTNGPTEKAQRRKVLFEEVEKLKRLITDNFYLRMAKSFESDHY